MGDAGGKSGGPAIVQIAVGESAWVIDTTKPSQQLQLFFSKLFGHDRIQFLGFAFAHDIKKLSEMMQGLNGGSPACAPRHVLDLQKLAKLDMDKAYTPGLKTVVAKWLDLDLDKTEQCSDWDRRPLSSSQVHYAAADAATLLDLASAMGVHIN